MRLILHIGLPKTATTTIQHRLSAVKPLLAEAGLSYPGHSVSHHEIARGLQAVEAGRASAGFLVDDLLTTFAAEARRVGARQVFISSESMVSATPGTVPRIGAALRRHFPEADEVLVLCYVREPIAFATSLGQQFLKSGMGRLHEVYANPWTINLRQALQTYAEAFGRESLRVRPFDPARLKDGDVVSDALAVMGLGDLVLPGATPVLNTALSSEGVQIADALVALRPRRKREPRKRRAYKRLLEGIGGTKFALPEAVQDLVIEQSRADLQALRDDYGVEITPQRVPVPAGPVLPAATADAVARMIERLVEGS